MLSLVAVAVMGMAAFGAGEEEGPGPVHLGLEEMSVPGQGAARGEDLLYVEAAARFTFPTGDVVSGGPKYGDLFGTGVGVGLQADYLWRLSRSITLGAYVEFDYDSFQGSSTTDSFGTTLKPDRMSTYRAMLGAKLREDFGPGPHFYLEEYMGFGANFYSPVNATLSGNGMDGSGQLFSAKTSFAFDFGANFGWALAPHVDLFLGLAVAVNGGPGTGRDIVIVSNTGSTTPGPMVNAQITLGVNFGF